MGNFNSFVDKLDMDFWHEACAKNGKLCHYKKGEFFVQQGDVIRYMGIVKEGYFKYVVTDSKGDEHITGLALPGAFVGDYLSTTHKTPCMTSLVAATNAEVLVCDCEVLNKVFDEDRELHQQLSDLLFHHVYKQYLDIIIRKTKCFDFWERNVLFPKTKRSFFRTPTPSTLPFSA